MANESENKKPGFQFNIIKDDPLTGHKGQNIGSISLENIAPVYIDIDTQETFIDMAGLHARAEVEKRVKWVADKSEVEGDGQKEYWIVWVAVERKDIGPVYAGVAACYQMVNKERRRGYKMMHEHVNMLDRAMKGKIDVGMMDDASKSSLKKFLQNHNMEIWENSGELKEILENH